MTTVLRSVVIFFFSALLMLSAFAASQSRDDARSLKVFVNVPPSWDPLVDDRISEAFVDRCARCFTARALIGR